MRWAAATPRHRAPRVGLYAGFVFKIKELDGFSDI
jgi:hypothetical protein